VIERRWTAGVVSVGCALVLGGLAWACAPAPANAPTPIASDPFAVVRATSQAAYQTGKDYMDRGETIRGCLLMDVAHTNDPDERPEIALALQQCMHAVMEIPPQVQGTIAPRASPSATRAQAAPTATSTSFDKSDRPRPIQLG
jgi:hypothetical protein